MHGTPFTKHWLPFAVAFINTSWWYSAKRRIKHCQAGKRTLITTSSTFCTAPGPMSYAGHTRTSDDASACALRYKSAVSQKWYVFASISSHLRGTFSKNAGKHPGPCGLCVLGKTYISSNISAWRPSSHLDRRISRWSNYFDSSAKRPHLTCQSGSLLPFFFYCSAA